MKLNMLVVKHGLHQNRTRRELMKCMIIAMLADLILFRLSTRTPSLKLNGIQIALYFVNLMAHLEDLDHKGIRYEEDGAVWSSNALLNCE